MKEIIFKMLLSTQALGIANKRNVWSWLLSETLELPREDAMQIANQKSERK